MHYTGTLESQTIKGTLALGRSKFKYSADIWIKVDVFWHKKPKGGPEPVKVTKPSPQERQLVAPTENTIDWQKIGKETKEIAAMVVITITSIALAWYARGVFLKQQFTTPPPFTHTIDRRNLDA